MKYIFKSFFEALKEVCIKRYRLFSFLVKFQKNLGGSILEKHFLHILSKIYLQKKN